MDKHFSIKDLLKFTSSSMAMMVFSSIYMLVDAFFVSNFAGVDSFAAMNFIMPIVMIVSSIGFMVGTGGTALVAKVRGEGSDAKANRIFTWLIMFAVILGLVFAVIGFFIMRPISEALGAEGTMLESAVLYGQISMVSITAYMLQFTFQSFFVCAGKPRLGFVFTVASGCINIILDALLVAVLGFGLVGAAWATVAAELTGGLAPIVYFLRPNSSYLRLGSGFTSKEGNQGIDVRAIAKVIGKTCVNGSSEMMTNIALSVVAVVYNWQLLRFMGESGVAAYGVIANVAMVALSLVQGYIIGVGPLMSYQYGAQNRREMRSLFKKSLLIIAAIDVVVFVLLECFPGVAAGVFVGYDAEVFDLTLTALRVYAIAFLLSGFSMYGSGLFTSLNNGLVSALISFLRTLVFETIAVLVLPMLFGAEAIWYAAIVAEVAAVIMVILCIVKYWKRYFSLPDVTYAVA